MITLRRGARAVAGAQRYARRYTQEYGAPRAIRRRAMARMLMLLRYARMPPIVDMPRRAFDTYIMRAARRR